MRSRSVFSFVAAAFVAGSTINATHATTTPQEAPSVDNSAEPTIDWKLCDDVDWPLRPSRRGYGTMQCGEMQAPLDYSNPDGETTTFRMTKVVQPGSNGTLFLVQGKPGEKQTFNLRIPTTITREVDVNYDIVSMDPRGVGLSNEFKCAEVRDRDYDRINWFPMNRSEASEKIIDDHKFRQECATTGHRLAQFMTTADYARDLDRARRALQEDKMRLLGKRYGSHVAVTYANLFPDKVGAIVADSVFDSNAWTHVGSFANLSTPAMTRTKGIEASRRAWDAAMTECENLGTKLCPGAKTIREDWEFVHQELPKEPLVIRQWTYDYRTYSLMGASAAYGPYGMAGRLRSIPSIAKLLRARKRANSGDQPEANSNFSNLGITDAEFESLRATLAPATPRAEDFGLYKQPTRADRPGPRFPWFITPPRLMQPTLAVVCSETFNPIDPTGISRVARQKDTLKPGEGAARVWEGSACAQWPFRGKNAYRGDYRTAGANGVLLINREYDPLGSYRDGAQKMRRTLPGSKLVTLKGAFGVSGLGNSHCANRVATRYLNTGELPESDVTCTDESGLSGPLARLGRWD